MPYAPKEFGVQGKYVNTSLATPFDRVAGSGSTLELYILQMPDETQSCGLYASLVTATLYKKNTWTDPSVPDLGTKSRVTDSGADWWINFCRGSYYVEVRLTPSNGPGPDYISGSAKQKEAAFAFANAILSKL